MDNAKYYIWSFEHNAWWRGGEWGYTNDIGEAGIYSHEVANKICLDANVHGNNISNIQECMVPVAVDIKEGDLNNTS